MSELVGELTRQVVPGDPAERILSWEVPAGTAIEVQGAQVAVPFLDRLRSGEWTAIDLTRDPALRPLVERLHRARALEWT